MLPYHKMHFLTSFLCLVGLLFQGSYSATSQVLAELESELYIEVTTAQGNKVSDDKLTNAKLITDVFPGYPSSWINEDNYISTELVISNQSTSTTLKGGSDRLSNEQIIALSEANVNDDITIKVVYKENGPTQHHIQLTTTVIPFQEAYYGSDQSYFITFVKENMLSSAQTFSSKDISAFVRFVVDKDGTIQRVVFEDTTLSNYQQKELSDMLYNMPKWTPAKDKDGKPSLQSLILRIGNLEGC